MTSTSDMVARVDVIRGVNEVRVAALFVLLSISIGVGVTAGFEQNSPPIGVGCGGLTFLLLVGLLTLVYRWPWLRHRVMVLMHWITGQ